MQTKIPHSILPTRSEISNTRQSMFVMYLLLYEELCSSHDNSAGVIVRQPKLHYQYVIKVSFAYYGNTHLDRPVVGQNRWLQKGNNTLVVSTHGALIRGLEQNLVPHVCSIGFIVLAPFIALVETLIIELP